jgi:hypothetical protein
MKKKRMNRMLKVKKMKRNMMMGRMDLVKMTTTRWL